MKHTLTLLTALLLTPLIELHAMNPAKNEPPVGAPKHEAGPFGPASVVGGVCEVPGSGRFVVVLYGGSAACRPLAHGLQ